MNLHFHFSTHSDQRPVGNRIFVLPREHNVPVSREDGWNAHLVILIGPRLPQLHETAFWIREVTKENAMRIQAPFHRGRVFGCRRSLVSVSRGGGGEPTRIQRNPSYALFNLRHQSNNSQAHTLLAFDAQETRGPGTFELREQRLADDRKHEEWIAFLVLEEGPGVDNRSRVTPPIRLVRGCVSVSK